MQQLPQSQDSAPLRGLSTQQAEALRAQGLSNQQSDTGGKSAGEIIRSNAGLFSQTMNFPSSYQSGSDTQ